MGLIDQIQSFFKKITPKVTSNDETIEIVDPDARDLTANITIGAAVVGILSLLAIDIGILSPPPEFVWIPLGVITALLMINPVVRLKGFWEAVVIFLMFANVIGYLIVFERAELTNTLVVAIALFLIVIVVEYPRRFTGK